MRPLLRAYVRPHARGLALLGLFLAGTTVLQLTGPLLTRRFIDLAQAGAGTGDLAMIAGAYVASVVAVQVISVADAFVAGSIAWRATNRLRDDLFLHCMRLDLPFHHEHTPGALIERIDGDVTTLQNLFSSFLVNLAGSILLLLCVLAVLLAIDWRIGLYMTLLSALVLAVLRGLREVPRASLRAHVALVAQEVQLLNATVRDNLTLFDASVPDTRIHEAVESLGLAPLMARLPGGLDTVLAPGGTDLSAGEAQLLALARALLLDPGLVVLDEASSRIDPATERMLDAAMDRLLRGRTAVVIAHRLSTIERADRVLVLERGRVREEGRRTSLLADGSSRLAELLRAGLEETPA